MKIRFMNRAGLGIVEVLIALAIMTLLTLGLMTTLTETFKQQRSVQAKDGIRELTSEIRNVISDKMACTNSFGGNMFTGTGADFYATSIMDSAGNVKYQVGQTYINHLLELSRLRVAEYVSDTATTGKAKLYIYAKKTGQSAGPNEIRQVLSLKVKLDSLGRVIECLAIGGLADSLWQIATNPSDIFYPVGNVGISNPDPKVSLDVAGEIKPGNTGIACSSVVEGAIRYNQSLRQMQYCAFDSATSSHIWRSLGGAQIYHVLTPGQSVTVPAGTCPNLIVLQAWMRAKNADNYASVLWVDFPIADNGSVIGNLILYGGKTGSRGHGWHFKHDMSRTFYINSVASDHVIQAGNVKTNLSPNGEFDGATLTVTCL